MSKQCLLRGNVTFIILSWTDISKSHEYYTGAQALTFKFLISVTFGDLGFKMYVVESR